MTIKQMRAEVDRLAKSMKEAMEVYPVDVPPATFVFVRGEQRVLQVLPFCNDAEKEAVAHMVRARSLMEGCNALVVAVETFVGAPQPVDAPLPRGYRPSTDPARREGVLVACFSRGGTSAKILLLTREGGRLVWGAEEGLEGARIGGIFDPWERLRRVTA